LIGLFGQAAAYASIPPAASVPTTIAAIGDDCMQMMAQPQPKPASQPCKGLTLACIAAMGCVVPLAITDPYVIPTVSPVARPAHSMATARPLATRVVAPEPEPPTLVKA
jgi:hypothetical protein